MSRPVERRRRPLRPPRLQLKPCSYTSRRERDGPRARHRLKANSRSAIPPSSAAIPCCGFPNFMRVRRCHRNTLDMLNDFACSVQPQSPFCVILAKALHPLDADRRDPWQPITTVQIDETREYITVHGSAAHPSRIVLSSRGEASHDYARSIRPVTPQPG